MCRQYEKDTKSITELFEINPNIEVLGEYENNRTKIKVRCKIHDFIWSSEAYSLLNNHGCPICASEKQIKKQTKLHDQFIKELFEINPDIEVLDEYKKSELPIKFKCKIDGYEWLARPNDMLRNHGCPLCGGNLKKSHEQFTEELLLINPNIEILSKYKSANQNIRVRCKIDGYEWETVPNTLFYNKTGCPKCVVI